VGAVVSPLLLNVALHGMEEVAGARYTAGKYAGRIMQGCPTAIRYADDVVVLCHSRQEALEVKARLASWLAPRGLAFNEDKTRVVSLDEGFDFLGFNVRRYNGKPLIKPSKAAVRRIRKRLREEMRSLRGSNAHAVVRKLNPIVRGWAAYYRTQVSSDVFNQLDQHLWRLTWKWARYSHQNKPKTWVFARYYGKFNKSRQDRWVFGDRNSGAYLHKFSWTRILRHRLVRPGASPDDPALTSYWAWRRRKGVPLPTNKTTQELTDSQDGRCAICGGLLFAVEDRPQNPREWEKWLAIRTAVITTAARPGRTEEAAPRLIHAECRRGLGPELRDAHEPSGLA
jgi:RNA-directed DNA polymerase